MRKTCRFCNSKKFKLIIDLGKQPLAGEFLELHKEYKEKYYHLRVYQCINCGLVQLRDVVPRKELFKSFLSSVSMKKHFKDYAEEIVSRFLNKGDFVVEIGSNDGVLLKPLKGMGMKVLGVEPTKYIAKLSIDKGIETRVDFFSEELAKNIGNKRKANIILANNVFAHIDNMDDVMRGIKYLLDNNGYFIFENQFFVDTVEKTQYDTIYHEHLNYYTISALVPFLKKYGFEIVEIKRIGTHSGSVRVYAKKFEIGNFESKIKKQKIDLTKLLTKLKKQNKTIIGYGAAGRANTMLNYCGIDKNELDYIIDESPLRYNHITPGSHIPVIPLEKAQLDKADYILILAWNYTKEIISKVEKIGWNGKFIVPLPEVKIL